MAVKMDAITRPLLKTPKVLRMMAWIATVSRIATVTWMHMHTHPVVWWSTRTQEQIVVNHPTSYQRMHVAIRRGQVIFRGRTAQRWAQDM